MALDLSRLRFVCMQCPAVATTRLAEYEPETDELLVWIECHREQVFGSLHGQALQRLRVEAKPDSPINVPMQTVRSFDLSLIEARRNSIEQQLMRLGAMMDVYDRFLAEDGPKTAPSRDDEPSEAAP